MKKRSVLLLWFTLLAVVSWGNTPLDSLLNVLEQVLSNQDTYLHQRQQRIARLKAQSNEHAGDPAEQYRLNQLIYKEYKPFICDSAIHYANLNITIAEQLQDDQRLNESKLMLSYLLTTGGMYAESLDILRSVNRARLGRDLLPDYFLCFTHVYGELGAYTREPNLGQRYRNYTRVYKDSMYAVLTPGTEAYLDMTETRLREQRQFEQALKINDRRLAQVQPDTPPYALITYYRSLIFQENGDRDREKQNLCLSAIADIRSAIKDHASLWMLAELIYEDGDIERAYRYMNFSWNDTKFYNARLRSWQSADILSMIDTTRQAIIEKQNNSLQRYLLLITLLVVLLGAALGYIYRQMKKLADARNHLQQSNTQLNGLNDELRQMNECLTIANTELTESNQIKEEYIARFLKLSSTYIDRLEAYRRMVNKKIMGQQITELLKITRSPNALEEELAQLYNHFDTAFLHLFPRFVEQFNDLLQESDRIVPKKGELLNTELRIFALIRLGIDDSSQIAEFLRYSVNTIYNYRAKVKNKARVSRDDFEVLVRQLR